MVTLAPVSQILMKSAKIFRPLGQHLTDFNSCHETPKCLQSMEYLRVQCAYKGYSHHIPVPLMDTNLSHVGNQPDSNTILLQSVKPYHSGWKTGFIPPISEILPQQWYHCSQYTNRHHMNITSHSWPEGYLPQKITCSIRPTFLKQGLVMWE